MEKYCHLKLDGHMLMLEPCYAFTRQYIDIKDKLAFMQLPQVPEGFIVHGELWAPGYKASSVKTLINAESTELQFTPWAVEGLPAHLPLEDVNSWCASHGFDFAPYWYEEPAELPPNAEGYVFKNGNMLDFRKWKPVLTCDCVVTALVPGKGKFSGMVGSLECTIEDRVVANVSGMTDDERTAMGPHCVGQVVEIAYQYVGSKGRLRHPRFIRFRDDKRPDQCKLEQLNVD